MTEETTEVHPLLTFREAGARLRCSAVTIRRMVRDGELAGLYVRSRRFIQESEVERYLREESSLPKSLPKNWETKDSEGGIETPRERRQRMANSKKSQVV